MTERLLQFIWQFRYFNKGELETESGEPIQIITPGTFNSNQGPDFSNAKIKIGKETWAGNIELHVKTSDWDKHKHELDKNYKNVILHVVWEHDAGLNEKPVLELRSRVSRLLLQRYEEMMLSHGIIPCQHSISNVRPIIIDAWKENLLVERLMLKTSQVNKFLEQNNNNWEETFWWMLARNFGMKINADAFEELARSLPLNILAKHKNQIHQLEALLLGQAGLLNHAFKEDYPILLKKEYVFLSKKYGLKPIHQPVHFLRMRPGNFPTIRLAQLAVLINLSSHLFSKIKEAGSVDEVYKWIDITANDYWHYHYRFDSESGYKKKKLGSSMIENILINTVCLVLFAYGQYHKEEKYKLRAINWLEKIKPETNSITKGFTRLGVENKNARDSQALIELKNLYCSKKRCLDCAIGNAILKAN